jgi:hypothetical protein
MLCVKLVMPKLAKQQPQVSCSWVYAMPSRAATHECQQACGTVTLLRCVVAHLLHTAHYTSNAAFHRNCTQLQSLLLLSTSPPSHSAACCCLECPAVCAHAQE